MVGQIEEGGDFSMKPLVWTKRKDLDDDLVVTQILVRLPVKSLMRFKSVSKPWKSTIEQDSHFINLHRTHATPQLFTIVFDHGEHVFKVPRLFHFLLADLDCGDDDVRGASIQTSWSVRVPSTYTEDVGLVPCTDTQVKGPVRGLLCFINSYNVRIYNVCTRQFVTPWIRSTVSMSRYDKLVQRRDTLPLLENPDCEFVIDPDTGKYKVILVWYASPREGTAACEVLTVGDDSNWRVLDVVPPASEFSFVPKGTYDNGTYANGSIYWMYNNKGSVSLVAFDIGPEKFRTIRICKSTLSMLSLFICEPYPYIMELDGCLTVVRTQSPPTLKLWKFHDRNKEGTLTYTSERGEDWSEVIIEMPSYIPSSVVVIFHPVPGKDQMMILETWDKQTTYCDGNISYSEMTPMNVKLNCFYFYNGVNKTFNKFEIQGIPSLSDRYTSRTVFIQGGLLPAAAENKAPELRLGR
ncbi:Putative F-box protein At1g47730 [Linum grandiflorum]